MEAMQNAIMSDSSTLNAVQNTYRTLLLLFLTKATVVKSTDVT